MDRTIIVVPKDLASSDRGPSMIFISRHYALEKAVVLTHDALGVDSVIRG
jgi:hypothetical protein